MSVAGGADLGIGANERRQRTMTLNQEGDRDEDKRGKEASASATQHKHKHTAPIGGYGTNTAKKRAPGSTVGHGGPPGAGLQS